MIKKESDDIHPNAPAGGGGPGAFRSATPLGMNPSMDKWLRPGPLGTNIGSCKVPRLYFAIYYSVSDNAFKRAAETWARNIRVSVNTSKADKFMLLPAETEPAFKKVWAEVAMQAKNHDLQRGALFTHASKDDESDDDGLEFKPVAGDGTLGKADIYALPVLPWGAGAQLELMGCNTGKSAHRGWCPAEIFAKHQRVRTTGQAGYAYFSANADSYSEINAHSPSVYLWAYHRRKNGFFGDGSRMTGISFQS